MIDDVATSLWIFQLIPLSASYMRQWTGPSMVQVMVCRLFGAKLPEPMLIYCQFQFYPWEQVSVKFKSEFHHGLLSYRQRPKVDNKIFVQTRPLRDWHNRWLVQFAMICAFLDHNYLPGVMCFVFHHWKISEVMFCLSWFVGDLCTD